MIVRSLRSIAILETKEFGAECVHYDPSKSGLVLIRTQSPFANFKRCSFKVKRLKTLGSIFRDGFKNVILPLSVEMKACAASTLKTPIYMIEKESGVSKLPVRKIGVRTLSEEGRSWKA